MSKTNNLSKPDEAPTTSSKFSTYSKAGGQRRSHCLADSRKIFCQRSDFFLNLSADNLVAVRSELNKTILFAPSSVDFCKIKSRGCSATTDWYNTISIFGSGGGITTDSALTIICFLLTSLTSQHILTQNLSCKFI